MLSVGEMKRKLGGFNIKRTHFWLRTKDEVRPRCHSHSALYGTACVPVADTNAGVNGITDVERNIVLFDVFHCAHGILHN